MFIFCFSVFPSVQSIIFLSVWPYFYIINRKPKYKNSELLLLSGLFAKRLWWFLEIVALSVALTRLLDFLRSQSCVGPFFSFQCRHFSNYSSIRRSIFRLCKFPFFALTAYCSHTNFALVFTLTLGCSQDSSFQFSFLSFTWANKETAETHFWYHINIPTCVLSRFQRFRNHCAYL